MSVSPSALRAAHKGKRCAATSTPVTTLSTRCAPCAYQYARPTSYQPQLASGTRERIVPGAAATEMAPRSALSSASGHSALLHGLGDLGDLPPGCVPWLLRIAHARARMDGGDSADALQV